MSCRQRLEGYLRENGAPFQVQHHARAITAQEVAATEHIPGKMFARTVIVLSVDKEEPVMPVLPAPYHVNLHKAAATLGAREVLLAEEEFEGTFPDCEVGAMLPFGNLHGVRVYADFERLVEPTVAELADPPNG